MATDQVQEKLLEARSILADAISDAQASMYEKDQRTCLKFGYFRATKNIPDKSGKIYYTFHDVHSLRKTMQQRFNDAPRNSTVEQRAHDILQDCVDFLGNSDSSLLYLDNIITYPKGQNERAYTIPLQELTDIVLQYQDYLEKLYQKIIQKEAEALKRYEKPE